MAAKRIKQERGVQRFPREQNEWTSISTLADAVVSNQSPIRHDSARVLADTAY